MVMSHSFYPPSPFTEEVESAEHYYHEFTDKNVLARRPNDSGKSIVRREILELEIDTRSHPDLQILREKECESIWSYLQLMSVEETDYCIERLRFDIAFFYRKPRRFHILFDPNKCMNFLRQSFHTTYVYLSPVKSIKESAIDYDNCIWVPWRPEQLKLCLRNLDSRNFALAVEGSPDDIRQFCNW